MTIPATVLDEIRVAVVEAFHSVPRGGVEIGGVFFGIRSGDTLRIQAHRPIQCQYLTGPSFKLSEEDRAGLSRLLEQPTNDPELRGLVPAGWYHSHTRSEIFLSAEDLRLYGDFFPEPWQISLVLRPGHLKPTRAGIFFRDESGGVQADRPRQEFVIDPPDYGLALADPENEEYVPPPPPLEKTPVDREIVHPRGAIPTPPPKQDFAEAAPNAPDTKAAEKILRNGILEAKLALAREAANAAARELSRTPEPPIPVSRPEPAKKQPEETVPLPAPDTETKSPAVEPATWRDRFDRLFKRMAPGVSERRFATREPGDGLNAFYWDGAASHCRRVRDISKRGLFIETDFPWSCGTLINLTLQMTSNGKAGPNPESILVPTEVVRTTADGMGVRFVVRDLADRQVLVQFLYKWKPAWSGPVK